MKIGVISDTHNRHRKLKNIEKYNIDCLVCCGDTHFNTESYKKFIKWFGKLNIKYKILISGNHDIEIWKNFKSCKKDFDKYNIIYLQDESIEIEGVKFYGTPWSPVYGQYYFTMEDCFLSEKWKQIPKDTEILITHCPSYKELDLSIENENCGSYTLSLRKKELKELKYHLFGHIHECRGILKMENYTNINASCFNYNNDKEVYSPIIINI